MRHLSLFCVAHQMVLGCLVSSTFITSSRKSWLVDTKSVMSAYCIFIGSPSSRAVAGVVGKLGHICWKTISKVVVNATGLNLST